MLVYGLLLSYYMAFDQCQLYMINTKLLTWNYRL